MAQKLKFGAGQWATKEGSTLAYNDENSNFKPLPFTTTRASSATRVNKEGLIEVVGNGIPRIDYADSAEGVLLLENSSTNLITYSEDFSNSYWTKTGSSVTSDVATSPDGSLNSDKLDILNTIDEAKYLNSSVITVGGGTATVVTTQMFVKKSEVTVVGLSDGHYNYGWVVADLTNGSVISVGGAGYISNSIKLLANDWYLISLTFTTHSTGTYKATCSLLDDSYVSGNPKTYTSIGVIGFGVYIYAFQTEQNSFPTSYIPTSGATATRLADTASGAGNSEVFNDSEGVLFADLQGLNELYRLGISENASTSNRILIGQSSSALSYIVTSGSTSVVNSNVSGYGLNQKLKIAAKYKQNDFAFWVNGFEVITVSSGNTPTNLNSLDLNGQGFNAYIKTKEIGYYDTALTDEELEYMTSYRSLSELVTILNLNTL